MPFLTKSIYRKQAGEVQNALLTPGPRSCRSYLLVIVQLFVLNAILVGTMPMAGGGAVISATSLSPRH